MALGILIPTTIFAIVAVVVAAVAFVGARWRSGEGVLVTFGTVLLAYFSLMSLVSFLVMASGLTAGVKAGLTVPLGRGFSYWTPPRTRLAPAMPPGETGKPVDLKQQPVPQEELDRQEREVGRQYQEDLLQGATLAVIGGLVWAAHTVGRRRLSVVDPDAGAFFGKAYTTTALAIFGVVGIIALPVGVYEALRYVVIQPDEFSGRQPPGGTLAAALIFVPIWLYYLNAVVRRSQKESA